MDLESFKALALRVICGDATGDEHRVLEAELASIPGRREEFERLRLTHQILRVVSPITQAAQAASPELPAYRVNELRTAVRQHFGPAASDRKTAAAGMGTSLLRWLFAGCGTAALAVAIGFFCFANQVVEVGLYQTDLARGGGQSLSASDVPSARLVTFDRDAPFDQWQNRPLAWNEHAKIWVDNERDLLHIVRRTRYGQVLIETQPLAPTDEGQREQIKRVVGELKN